MIKDQHLPCSLALYNDDVIHAPCVEASERGRRAVCDTL